MPKTVGGTRLLRIGEVARRAGVNRGTIQHYLREGLLPKPVKTHRNMAWYDESFVERIKQIRRMQSERFLPLSVIKRLLGPPGKPGGLARSLAQSQENALATLERSGAPIPREQAPEAFGIPRERVDDLLRVGLVSVTREGGRETFSGPDLEVLAAIANFERRDFTKTLGFTVDDLVIYKDALQELLNEEVATFLRVMAKSHGRAGTRGRPDPDLARSVIEGGTMLILALRRKLIRDFLSEASPELLDAFLAEAKRTRGTESVKPGARKRRR